MEILTKRWYLLAIACVINLCTGSIYAWSVFAGPKAAQLSQLPETYPWLFHWPTAWRLFPWY